MPKPLRIGIAGLGTVGQGVVQLLEEHSNLLEERAGRPLEIVGVSARDRSRQRSVPLEKYHWFETPQDLCAHDSIDVVVEVIGGSDGIARDVVETALDAGKHVVTANKALIALEGFGLAKRGEDTGAVLAYEAAVAGAIPIVKLMREAVAGNEVSTIYGILNGTSNFILSEMRDQREEFHEALAKAQELGYAEADPSFDVDGIDAAHKLAILAAIGFGQKIDFDKIYIEGIRKISFTDIVNADKFGCRIKLMAVAKGNAEQVELRVHPVMVPTSFLLAHVNGADNAIQIHGDYCGPLLIKGVGAGAKPTASAVVSDLVDLARGTEIPAYSLPVGKLKSARQVGIEEHNGRYYLRIMVLDKPGVMAQVTAIFRDCSISIESILQHGRAPGETVPIILITHESDEIQIQAAQKRLRELEDCISDPTVIRIEDE